MEVKHPLESLLEGAQVAVRSVASTLASTLAQGPVAPLAERAEGLLDRFALVPKSELDRLRADIETLQKEVARLETRLNHLGESR